MKTLTLLKRIPNARGLKRSQRLLKIQGATKKEALRDEAPNTCRDRTDQARRLGLRAPEDDLRGKAVYNAQGQRMGSVDDLYIDPEDREVRFLEVGAGGFLGMGEKSYLVLVEAVTEVAEDRVTIEPGRTEKVEGPAPFDTKVAPPPTDESDAYARLPYGNAEGAADRRDSSLRDIHRPY